MPFLPGQTMTSLIKDHILTNLEYKDLALLGKSIGEIAIFDLLTGNPDRFVRFSLNAPYFEHVNFNMGNILVDCSYVGEDPKRCLQNVYLIDNSSNQTLPLLKETHSSIDNENDSLFGFFNDESEVKTTPTLNPTSEKKDPKKVLEETATNMTTMFKVVVGDLSKIETYLEAGLEKELSKAINKKEILKPISENLTHGFDSAFNKIKNTRSEKVFSVLDKENCSNDPYYKTLYGVIKENMDSIKKNTHSFKKVTLLR